MKRIFILALLVVFSAASPALAKKQRAPAGSVNPLHFFTFGDWGTGNQAEKNVEMQTQKVCALLGCDFGLFLGDNFYEDGVTSVDDPKWNSRYVDIYHPLKVPMYAIVGNHDWNGNAKAQVEYTKKDPYWKMPAFNYSFSYPINNNRKDKTPPLVEVFAINTSKFTHEAEVELSTALDKSRATWKILALHHPIIDNAGGDDDMDQKKLWPKLRPLVCGKIDVMLSSDEHFFSHLKDTSDTCKPEQLIIGTGGRRLETPRSVPKNIQLFYTESSHGLGFFEVFPTELQFRFIREDGTVPYKYVWKK